VPIIIDYNVEVRPIAVSNLILRAGILLQDEAHVRWTTPELFEWINEAAAAVVRLKPAAGARRALFSMETGSLQRLDGTVVQLIDIVRNIANDGVTPGRAVRLTDRHLLDSANPDWHSMTPSVTIRHYTYDDRMPSMFYVYPPAASGAQVEIIRAILPDEITTINDELQLNVEFADSILNYVLFRAFSKDSEYASGAMATGYYQAFTASVGAGDTGEQGATPINKVTA
jgi:hypothetical protein